MSAIKINAIKLANEKKQKVLDAFIGDELKTAKEVSLECGVNHNLVRQYLIMLTKADEPYLKSTGKSGQTKYYTKLRDKYAPVVFDDPLRPPKAKEYNFIPYKQEQVAVHSHQPPKNAVRKNTLSNNNHNAKELAQSRLLSSERHVQRNDVSGSTLNAF